MSIQIQSAAGTTLAGGEVVRAASLHTLQMPFQGNNYRAAMFTGTIGAALAAGSELFQFRFVTGSKTKCLVHSVKFCGAGIVAVATALGPIGWHMTPARAWTVAGSGGTRFTNSGDNMQLEHSIANSQCSDIGVATTGALTAGTKTLDGMSMGMTITSVLTGAATVQQTSILANPDFLFRSDENGGMPLVLENNEGFVIRTTHAGPTSLTYVAGFAVSWTEVAAF
jgi:hypothetical protein